MLLGWKNMTSYKRGDVILVRFPNSDLITYIKRPALVVQADAVKTGLPQRIAALITSNIARQGPSRVLILKDSSQGKTMGILQDSVVVADNLATIHDRQIDRAIGRCQAMEAVDTALRSILAL